MLGLAQIGAGDGVAEVQQNLRDAAHADAANPNEMNTLRFGKHSWGRKRVGTHFHLTLTARRFRFPFGEWQHLICSNRFSVKAIRLPSAAKRAQLFSENCCLR